jgi:hypothetical protein
MPHRQSGPALTPERVKAQIVTLDEAGQRRLLQLLLDDRDPANSLGLTLRCLYALGEHHGAVIRYLEETLKKGKRQPDDPDADEILTLKRTKSLSELAVHYSQKEGETVSVSNVRSRYRKALARQREFGRYVVVDGKASTYPLYRRPRNGATA